MASSYRLGRILKAGYRGVLDFATYLQTLKKTPPGPFAFEAETAALVTRFTTPPDDARKLLINDLIVSLKYYGIWKKLDCLYLLAAADAQTAQRNWIQDLFNLVPTNAPAFTADRGYLGNGTTSYLETGFNPTTAVAPKYSLNNSMFGFWSRTATAGNRDMGAATGGLAYISARTITTNLFTARNNRAVDASGANADGTGHYQSNRESAAAAQLYKNNVLANTNSTATAIPNSNFRILAGDTTFGLKQISAAYIGKSLTTAERVKFQAVMNVYLAAVGA